MQIQEKSKWNRRETCMIIKQEGGQKWREAGSEVARVGLGNALKTS